MLFVGAVEFEYMLMLIGGQSPGADHAVTGEVWRSPGVGVNQSLLHHQRSHRMGARGRR